jgi:hypothetical protein
MQRNKDSVATASVRSIDFIFSPYLTLETEPFGFAKNASNETSG